MFNLFEVGGFANIYVEILKTHIPELTGVIKHLVIKMGMEEQPEKEKTNG
jgi:hypothetical protein